MLFYNATLRTVPLLIIAACGPKTTGEEADKEPADLLADACESFCERALACPLGIYADEWEFQDEQTCASQCMKFHADVVSDPPEACVLIRANLWSCAGEIETCELFDAFEDATHELPSAFENPCFEEYKQFIQDCNHF